MELHEKYLRIHKKHKRIDFSLVDRIVRYVRSGASEAGLKASDIAKVLNEDRKKVSSYLSRYITEHKYLQIAPGGSSRAFFSAEDSEGGFKSVGNIGKTVKMSFQKILDFFKNNKYSLNEQFKNDLESVEKTLEAEKPDLGAYNRLVELLWAKKQSDFLRLSWLRTANRYA